MTLFSKKMLSWMHDDMESSCGSHLQIMSPLPTQLSMNHEQQEDQTVENSTRTTFNGSEI